MLSKNQNQFVIPSRNYYFLLCIALIGSFITAGQSLLLVGKGDIFCLNQGCEVVESLTTIPPLVFNIAGLVFFLLFFLGIILGRKGDVRWFTFTRFLGLAGIAVEGVLVGFQYYVAQVFCSYCLIILAIIVLLNLSLGKSHILAAGAVFIAVLAAFSSLQFAPVSQTYENNLDSGSYGQIGEASSGSRLYLFFSSSCPHCEEVIATLGENFTCNMSFNPIDTLPSLAVPGLVEATSYSPEINLRYLKTLGIGEIPVLVVDEAKKTTILKGKSQILLFLNDNCLPGTDLPAAAAEDYSTGMSVQRPVLPYYNEGTAEEGCAVEEDCVEGEDAGKDTR